MRAAISIRNMACEGRARGGDGDKVILILGLSERVIRKVDKRYFAQRPHPCVSVGLIHAELCDYERKKCTLSTLTLLSFVVSCGNGKDKL